MKYGKILLATGLLFSLNAEAALYDRGSGLIYDDQTNLTWLQDVNYAKTSGFDGDGLMNWDTAQTWVSNLVYHDSLRNIDLAGWRLPNTIDTGTAGCNFGNEGTDCGFNVDNSSSELAYMLQVNLQNLSGIDGNGNPRPNFPSSINVYFPDAEQANSVNSYFINLVDAYGFWSVPYGPNSQYEAWSITPYGVLQGTSDKFYHELSVWAVRDGDVAPVPIPGAIWLFGSGVLGLLGLKSRKV